MTTIHLMCGFIGFGKTTIAKQMAEKLPAVCLTHDEFMVKLYGRNIPYEEFRSDYEKVDDVLWNMAEKIIAVGVDVIMDYGFWSHADRKKVFERAQNITESVVFHNVCCDMVTAKQRILKRSAENPGELLIGENEFNTLAKNFEQWNYEDDYPVVLHNARTTDYIGQIVKVKIDRPKGSKHPQWGFEYPINYGFVPFTKSSDGEELDAYVLMEDKPLNEYEGRCVAVVHRTDDDDDKLIVVPEAYDLADEQIEEAIAFQEKWFKHVLIHEN